MVAVNLASQRLNADLAAALSARNSAAAAAAASFTFSFGVLPWCTGAKHCQHGMRSMPLQSRRGGAGMYASDWLTLPCNALLPH